MANPSPGPSAEPSAPIVSLCDVVKDYPLGKLTVRAIRGVDLDIQAGEFTVIAGPSGSGKTTLLNMIGCIDTATSGTVLVGGQDTAKLSDRKLTQLRLDTLGFIFQSFNLVNVLDAFQNVQFPLLLQGTYSAAERKDMVEGLLQRVGLGDQIHKRPNELSGGQRQRVAIARALVTTPRIVLADEPTANLDSKTGNDIVDLMRELNRDEGTTFIFSTHDQNVIDRADRIVRIVDGLIADDTAQQRVQDAGA